MSVPKTAKARHALAAKREGHRNSFGEVLKTNSNGEGNGSPEGGSVDSCGVGTKGNAHGQAFGNVVQGYGQHEQGRWLPVGFNAFDFRGAKVDVQVGNQFVKAKQEQGAGKESQHRRHPGNVALSLRHFDGWGEQAPVACGNHDSARESEHSIEYSARNFFEQKNQGGARRGDQPGEGGRQEGKQYGMVLAKRF